jgi:DNA-binding XRE family transcriptional regulator
MVALRVRNGVPFGPTGVRCHGIHLTQAALAAEVGLAEKTLRQLEQGRGNLDSWRAVLEHLGLELVGRSLPPGETLGTRLADPRRRRRLGQRALAELIGVSQPTIVALEGQGRERLDTLERVLETLGALAYLAPRGQAKAFSSHAGNASTSNEWETPVGLLEALHTVFDRFDLDPCASLTACPAPWAHHPGRRPAS